MLHREDQSSLFPNSPPPDANADALRERMKWLRFEAGPEPRLHFELLAPAGWQWRTPEQAGNAPGLLLSLVDGGPEVAEISVTADELPREVSPIDWLHLRLEQAGHELLAARESHDPGGGSADLLTRVGGLGGAQLARTNIVKDGRRLFTLTCCGADEVYRERASDFFATLASFRLLHPEKAPLAEALLSFTALHPVVIGFRYPESWALDREILEPDACEVRLDNLHGEQVAGRLYLQARAAQRPAAMLAAWVARMESEGVLIEEPPRLVPIDPLDGFTSSSSFVARARRGDGAVEMELRGIALEGEGATLLLALRGPARAALPDWWAINKRAFDIARESLHVA